jgi:ADP-ribosylglycohydrolase
MYGAILGDIIGSPYEFNSNNYKAKDFPLFSERSTFTDDSVMTLAVAQAFLRAGTDADDELITRCLYRFMPEIGRRYPNCGYGGMFAHWILSGKAEPYNSFGNGSAMRVSSVAWLFDSLEAVRHAAVLSASVSHNHPEGVKGAEAVASAIFLARTGNTKDEIKEYVASEFGYDLSRTCDEIRPSYRMDETCQGSVPEAITAFLEGTDFEDVVRTAVSLGGDSDTIACMAGAIAEGFYGVPEELKKECRERLTPDLLEILDRFENRICA